MCTLTHPRPSLLSLFHLLLLQDENDPSKILSLFIMGEYEELNDLVLDGSKKLRDYKSQPDEVLVRMNRPRPLGYNQSSENHISFPSSPQASLGSSLTSFSSRKRGFSKDRVRQKFNIMPKSAPPKIKPHSRDGPSKRLVGGGGQSVTTSQVQSPNSRYASTPLGDSYRVAQPSTNNWGMDVDDQTSSNFAQCNLKSDWHDIFFHNSLWNCGNVNAAATSSTPNQSPRNQGYTNGNDQSYNNGSQYSAYGAGAGGYYSRNGYDEGRNPSGGYGYTRGNSNGVRDSTVVM